MERALATPVERLTWELCRQLDLWSIWYREELRHFDLRGAFEPKSGRMTNLPLQIANGELTLLDGLRSLLSSPDFRVRYPNPENQANTLLKRLLGFQWESAPESLKKASVAMCKGTETLLHGERGSSLLELLQIIFKQSRFRDLYLMRLHYRIVGKIPDDADLRRWSTTLLQEPGEFDKILIQWVKSTAYRSKS